MTPKLLLKYVKNQAKTYKNRHLLIIFDVLSDVNLTSWEKVVAPLSLVFSMLMYSHF